MISPKARETLEAMTMEDCVELSKLLAAKLERNIAERARYIRKDSGASAPQAAGGNMVDAGQTTGPANPALSTQQPAVVAWDLTLRCPACGSGVEGNARKYHCRNQRCSIGAAQAEAFVASRRGPTSQEMVEAERSFENGLIRYTSRGAVRQGGGR